MNQDWNHLKGFWESSLISKSPIRFHMKYGLHRKKKGGPGLGLEHSHCSWKLSLEFKSWAANDLQLRTCPLQLPIRTRSEVTQERKKLQGQRAPTENKTGMTTVMLLYGDLNCAIGAKRLTVVRKSRKLVPVSVVEAYLVSE